REQRDVAAVVAQADLVPVTRADPRPSLLEDGDVALDAVPQEVADSGEEPLAVVREDRVREVVRPTRLPVNARLRDRQVAVRELADDDASVKVEREELPLPARDERGRRARRGRERDALRGTHLPPDRERRGVEHPDLGVSGEGDEPRGR